MEPIHHLIMVRRRWRTLAVGALVGMVIALVWVTVSREPDAVPIRYFSATHKLIVDPEAASVLGVPNLLQVALAATGGDVPDLAAAELGGDPEEITHRVRTVTELEVSVIEVSAVATDPAEATRIADVFAETLSDQVGRRDTATYENQLAQARREVRERTDDLDDAERAVVELQLAMAEASGTAPATSPSPADEGAPDPSAPLGGDDPAVADADTTGVVAAPDLAELQDRLELARTERSRRADLLAEAAADLDALRIQGPPPALLRTLDVVAPVEIPAAEYRRRIDQGRRGENNWSSRDVPENAAGGDGLGGMAADPRVRVGVGGLVGAMTAAGLVLAQLRFDTRLRTRREVEEAFGLPLLAEVPVLEREDRRAGGVQAHLRPRSAVSEAYRMLRSALLFGDERDDHRRGRVVMVTSPGAAEGKTTTTANLGVLLAESGYDVLVVNCDHRLPRLHESFGCAYTPRRAILTGVERVTLVADVLGGDVNPTTVVDAQRTLIERARRRYDVILLDTAPVLATNDALALLPVTDEVILVAREGTTDRDAAADAVDLLRRHASTLVGVVLTASSGFGRSRYYRRHYGDMGQGGQRTAGGRRSRGSGSPTSRWGPARRRRRASPGRTRMDATSPRPDRAAGRVHAGGDVPTPSPDVVEGSSRRGSRRRAGERVASAAPGPTRSA